MRLLGAIARIDAAIILVLSIGIQRFVHQKLAGFRPFVIISLSASGLGLLAVELRFISNDTNPSIDAAKVISGLTSGIRLVGAGALFGKGTSSRARGRPRRAGQRARSG
ncbi:MgtC/SapB family protein [Sphingomonas sp. S1-29]|uniref:MgtC/SapB family protein n=1 Tax=Sphingomonas sp. S1-29 TaxID=2991074 RepID=UPI00223F8BF6|nr:MgtC/SapB family protein [Sphingomonas sp. S1-29]UZK70567.1 MgtC/SapB family protein [Sphingomonas sp. S1-29]